MAREEAQDAAEGRMIRLRTILATALQLGIAGGVMVLILIQRRVAVQDDRVSK